MSKKKHSETTNAFWTHEHLVYEQVDRYFRDKLNPREHTQPNHLQISQSLVLQCTTLLQVDVPQLLMIPLGRE